MQSLINNFQSGTKQKTKSHLLELSRPQEMSLRAFLNFIKIPQFLIFIVLLFVQAEMLHAENGVSGNNLPLKSGTINRTTSPDENRTASKADKIKNSLVDVAKNLDEIIATPMAEEPVTVNEIKVAKEPVNNIAPTTEVVTSDNVAQQEKTAETVQTTPAPIKLIAIEKANPISQPAITTTASTTTNTKPIFNKHDITGKLTSNDQWACVHDTENNLMWEVKSSNDETRSAKNLYTWYKPDTATASGIENGGRCEGNINCDTNAYVQAMNEKNFCGHNDWRLPTKEQLQTIVYLKNAEDPVKINKQYFPETVPSWYWTASENKSKDNFAWYVLFGNGIALNDLKERPKHIRLVRNTN